MDRIENNVEDLSKEVSRISLQLKTHELPLQGVFFDGQIFDAYEFASRLIKSANKSVVLIDNYIDEETLTHLSKKKKGVKIYLLTKNIYKQIKLDVKKANQQYKGFHLLPF